MLKLVEEQPQEGALGHQPTLMLRRINADNSRPRDLLCFWLIFLLVLGLAVLLAIFAAPAEVVIKSNLTELRDTLDHSCMNPCGFENRTLICNPFGRHNPNLGLMLRNLNALHQFSLIYLKLQPEGDKLDHNISQAVEVSLHSMRLISEKGVGRFVQQEEVGSKTIELKDQKESQKFNFYGEKVEHLVGFYRELSQSNYLLIIKFSNPEQLIKSGLSPTLRAILINPSFTLFVIIIRATGFLVTLVTGSMYLRGYLKVDKSERTLEQKLVLAMSALILVFNDPLYFLSVLRPSILLSALSAVFASQFIAFLSLFWIVVALRILKEEGRLTSTMFSPARVAVVALYFVGYFAMLSWYYGDMALAAYQGHFIVSPQSISPGLALVFELWLLANFTIYFMIATSIFQGGGAALWRSRSWLYLNFYFIVLMFVFALLTGSFYEENSRLLLVTFVSLNLYCLYMQYMFTSSFLQTQDSLVPVDGEPHESTTVELGDLPVEISSS